MIDFDGAGLEDHPQANTMIDAVFDLVHRGDGQGFFDGIPSHGEKMVLKVHCK